MRREARPQWHCVTATVKRVGLGTAALLATLGTVEMAHADAIHIDPAASCPEGTYQTASHAGLICTVQACNTPCPDGTVCRSQGFCYTMVSGATMDGPISATTANRYCDPAAGGCQDCRIHEACVPPLEDGATSKGGGESGLMPTSSNPGCSCRVVPGPSHAGAFAFAALCLVASWVRQRASTQHRSGSVPG